MRKLVLYFLLVFWCIVSLITTPSLTNSFNVAFTQATANSIVKRPNFLVILADDMGFSDIEPFGSEVPTPNLLALAKEGKILTDYHVMPTCSPTRSELLTGVDTHLNGLGTMYERITQNQIGKPGYQTYLNDKVITVADLLKDAGYHTIMSGKWHLSKIGMPVNGTYLSEPNMRGFEEAYTLLEGEANHFIGESPYNPVNFLENGKPVQRPEGIYSTDLFTDKMIDSIKKFHGDGKPLLMYLAFQATHTPFQVPQQYIQKYIGKYDIGWDTIRKERFEKQKELGIWPANMTLPNRFPPNPSWYSLSSEQQKYWSKAMATFAGMVDNMDYNIGKVINYLRQIGQYDNTFIMFTSDNGGSEVPDSTFQKNFASETIVKTASEELINNTYANIGDPTSWIGYGETGASVAVSPLSGFKATMYEGGIRSPFIVKPPVIISAGQKEDNNNSGITSNGNNIAIGKKNNAIINAFVHVLDMTPTFLDYAEVQYPGSMYKGKEIIVPTVGRSIKPLLEGAVKQVHGNDQSISEELFGNSAVFMGDYKGLLMRPPAGDGMWALYNVKNDPGENHNLATAANNAQVLSKIKLAYDKYAKDVGVILPDHTFSASSTYGSLLDIYGHKNGVD